MQSSAFLFPCNGYCKSFVRICDGTYPSVLMTLLESGWKAHTQKELALIKELTPLLHKLAQGREIACLAAYKEGR